MSTTTITIPKDSTFKLPEGRYRAVITQYKTKDVIKDSGQSQSATLLFEVMVPGMENFECLARKVVPVDPKAGSVMRRFLESLLGQSYFKARSNQQIDLKTVLEGMQCQVDLIHATYDETRYDFPLVDVEAIYPYTTDLISAASTPATVEGGQLATK
jgi:hypothetical protein